MTKNITKKKTQSKIIHCLRLRKIQPSTSVQEHQFIKKYTVE